jgi:hypothetical protein
LTTLSAVGETTATVLVAEIYHRTFLTRRQVASFEHIARIRVHLPTTCPERTLFRTVAPGLLKSGP